MALEGRFDDGVVRVGGDARQRYHDSRATAIRSRATRSPSRRSKRPTSCIGGDLEAVVDAASGERLGFREFVAREPGRGFRGPVSGLRGPAVAGLLPLAGRGAVGSGTRRQARRISRSSREERDLEMARLPTRCGSSASGPTFRPPNFFEKACLRSSTTESEITYFEVGRRDPTGTSSADAMLPADCEADLLADRVVVWEPPLSLYEQTFYGQPLEGREYDEPTLQCSLLEATYLAERGALSRSRPRRSASGAARSRASGSIDG